MNQVHLLIRRWSVCVGIFWATTSLLTCLSGCTSVAGTGSATLVRVIDASTNAPALDAYVSSVPIADNIVGPSISNYAFLGPGAAVVTLDAHGTHSVLAQLNGTFLAGKQHSVYLAEQGSTFSAQILTDQSAPAPAGFVSFRFVQQASEAGAVDVYLLPSGTAIADAKPVQSSLAPGTITPYVDFPAGTYQFAVASAGTTKGAYIGAATVFVGGQVRTILIVDQKLLSSPPVNVIIANDVN